MLDTNWSFGYGCRALVLMVLLAGARVPAAEFTSDVTTAAKPWTHLNFRNDPDAFQFAIVSDRTGGHREGVFESAVDKLNLLQPEFVITVGDAIEGYTEDGAVLDAQWTEFLGFVNRLEMPFFFVPGNHDNVNPVMREHYRRRFGRDYYAFVYRNVLFMALDSQQASPGMGDEQVAWAMQTLRDHPDVRWTLLFMHQPLWLHEEGNVRTTRKSIGAAASTGFGAVQQLLEGRPHSVFAGHFHEYIHYERLGQAYTILSATGGSSALRGTAFGEFDHAMWVTMTPEGPRMANLLLEGILPVTVRTEAQARFRQDSALRLEAEALVDGAGVRVVMPLTNPFSHSLQAEVVWELPPGQGWEVTPAAGNVDLPSGQTNALAFTVRHSGDVLPTAVPVAVLHAAAGNALPPSVDPLRFPVPLDPFLAAWRPTTLASRLQTPPVLDGMLEEAAWQGLAEVSDFRRTNLGVPSVGTRFHFTYDAAALYVAVSCEEPAMAGVRTNITARDGDVWTDDCVELMIGRTDDPTTYAHLAVNAAGVLYDAQGTDRTALNGQTRVAVAQGEAGWTLELALPWTDLGGQLAAGQQISLQLARLRPQDGEDVQFPPLNGSNHRRDLHGYLGLAP